MGDPIIKRGRSVGISLTGLILQHICACPKPGPGFPTSYGMVIFNFFLMGLRVKVMEFNATFNNISVTVYRGSYF